MASYTPSAARRGLSEKLIRSLEGYQVRLVLSPYHPALYARMMAERPEFAEIENSFRALANRWGIAVLGSYDPDRVGCVAADFFDGMHPNKICMHKVFADDFRRASTKIP